MIRTLFQRALILAAAALLAGCAGYRLGPTTGEPAGARSVQIRPVINHAIEPRVGEYLSSALRKQFQLDGTFRVETDDGADIIVTAVIVRLERTELGVMPNDVVTPQDYNLLLVAHVKAVERLSGKVLLDKDINGRSAVTVGKDLSSAERQIMPAIAQDLANNAVSQIANPAW